MMGVIAPAAHPAATTSLPRRSGKLRVFQAGFVVVFILAAAVVGDAIVVCIVGVVDYWRRAISCPLFQIPRKSIEK